VLAYCEVCRVVQNNPSRPYSHLLNNDAVKEIRTLTGKEFFGQCMVCRRIQIFAPIEKDTETRRRPSG
jgi:hypothetical protein